MIPSATHRAFTPSSVKRWRLGVALLAVLSLLAAACGSGGDSSQAADASPTEQPDTADTTAEEAAEPEDTAEPETVTEPEPTAEPEATEEPAAETAVEATEEPAEETAAEESDPVDAPDVLAASSLEADSCAFDSLVPLPREPDCYTLTVPEDWDNPATSDTITIPVALFPAVTPGDADPIVYLEGGPGGHALEGLMFQYPVLVAPFNETRDFIVYDQRGAGLSVPSLACPEASDATREAAAVADDPEDEFATELAALSACRDRLLGDEVDLTEYHSINSAHDLDALRTQLGYEQMNVLGISYGTRLAQTYARLYPDSMRTSVLDSVDPVEAELFSALSTNAQRAFRQLFDGCAADADCAQTYPDLEARYFALVDRLDAEPFSALYNQAFFASIPQLVDDAESDRYAVLEAMAAQSLVQADFISAGMNLSVQCHEDIPFDERSRLASYEPANDDYAQFTETVTGEELFDACDIWPSGTAEAVEDELVISDVPTLLLGGAYDPITPTSGFDQITPGLSTYWEVVFPHDGHGVSPTPCGAEIVNAFFDNPQAEPDSSCVADTAPPAFTPGGHLRPGQHRGRSHAHARPGHLWHPARRAQRLARRVLQ